MGSEWLFVIQPATWVKTSLGEVVDKCKGHIQTGPFGSQLHASDYVAAGIPSIMPKDIGENRIESAGIAQVSNDDAVRLSKHRVIPGDIIYSRRGDVEKRAIVREDQNGWLCGTGCIKIRTGSSVIQPKFLYYYLGHPIVRGWIKRHAIGATMPNLNTSIIRSIPISLPPLPEQRAIAHILGTLDDKIECNRRMNETLEKMAQAIFKSWFVDFDPVRWNMDAKNGKAVGKPPVPPEILKLFPDSFQESELGLIPKGWEVAALSRIAHLNSESWTARNTPAEVLYVDLANTKNGRINLVVPYEFSKAPSRARRVLRKDDTIIGTVRPGNRSFAYIHEDNLTGSTGFAVMRPIEKCFSSFVYLCLSRDEVIDHFAHLADGGAYPAIRPEVVAGFKCTQPGGDIIINFNKIVYPLIRSIGEREASIRSLALLRDTLLPKLISGELRIKDAEKFIEALS